MCEDTFQILKMFKKPRMQAVAASLGDSSKLIYKHSLEYTRYILQKYSNNFTNIETQTFARICYISNKFYPNPNSHNCVCLNLCSLNEHYGATCSFLAMQR